MPRHESKQSSYYVPLYNKFLEKHILKRIEIQLNRADF